MFRSILSIFRADSQSRGLHIYARCDRCGETLTTRVDRSNDLSVDYGEKPRKDTYFCRKVLVGSGPCYQKIEVELTFDHNRKLLERDISGGSFITQEEFQASRAE